MRTDSTTRIRTWIDDYGGRLHRIARAHSGSPADADDILQDAWMVILAQSDRLPDESYAYAWLVGIVINVARGKATKAARRQRLLEERQVGLGGATTQQTPVETRLLVDALWREIGELPLLQREVVLARLLGGMSTKEAAHAIQRSEGTVKASLYRALRKLKATFGTDIDEALERVRSSER